MNYKTHLKKGFGAAMGLIILSLGSVALVITTLGSALWYADSIYRYEGRIQKNLFQEACNDSAAIVRAKDSFASGTYAFKEFDCSVII